MSKWVLLLGGSTGHGAAIAKKLASEGYGIIAFHFDRGEAKKVANETSKRLSVYPIIDAIILIQMPLLIRR